LQTTDKVLPLPKYEPVDEEEVEEDEPIAETKIIEERATFEEVMIWGHEHTADTTEDPYMKGMEEWISFAEAVSVVCCLEALQG
jgi:ribonuclease H2 subunit C